MSGKGHWWIEDDGSDRAVLVEWRSGLVLIWIWPDDQGKYELYYFLSVFRFLTSPRFWQECVAVSWRYFPRVRVQVTDIKKESLYMAAAFAERQYFAIGRR